MKRTIGLCLCLALCLTVLAGGTAEEAVSLQELKAGDHLFFGNYEQDNVLENGKEPVEWIVLDREEDRAFLLSRYCLETRRFYDQRVAMYWGNSPLREWMNGEFFEELFSPEEQARVLTTTVENKRVHVKAEGEDTLDKLYLLSWDEVLFYFPEQSSRVAYPTEYAKNQECAGEHCTLDPDTGSCRWWLRTSGHWKTDICGVRLDGRLTKYGMQDVDWPTNTLRPVMWISLDDVQP